MEESHVSEISMGEKDTATLVHKIPKRLTEEIAYAAKHLLDFTVSPTGAGPGIDEVIPPAVVASARGIVIMHMGKVGLVFTGSGGAGVALARLKDGSWSYPMFFGASSIGFGFDLGVEYTHHIIVLQTDAAVRAFFAGADTGLAANLSAAAGPIGRALQADYSVMGNTAMLHWSKSKGLFVGATVDLRAVKVRNGDNVSFYGVPEAGKASAFVEGKVEPLTKAVEAAQPLMDALNQVMVDATVRQLEMEGSTLGATTAEEIALGERADELLHAQTEE